jgi:molybdenum cofactor guanylyltransferase
MDTLTAFILAGGKSSRMGSDKAFLELRGKPLLLHAIDLGRAVTPEVKIVGEPEKLSAYGPVIPDVYSGRGPLAGIHAALRASNSDWNLILAVDLPFLDTGFLNYLASQAESSGATVTVPSTQGRFQPLCAVYHRSFASSAERALSEGRNKIDLLFKEVPLRLISEEEMRANRFSTAMFHNLNTPEEWEQAKRQFDSKSL